MPRAPLLTAIVPPLAALLPRWITVLGLLAGSADGASPADDPSVPGATPSETPGAHPDLTRRSWNFSASIYGYLVPDDRDYAQPTVTADHGALHFEARYQYEALETGSAWIGYNFAGEGKVRWEFTPMLGGVFGETMGVAPGYRGSLSWWRLELATEGECVIDAGDTEDSFVYTWTELALAPVEHLRFGLAVQRTKTYGMDREIQWGPLAGVSFHRVDFTTYLFQLDDPHPIVVLAVGTTY